MPDFIGRRYFERGSRVSTRSRTALRVVETMVRSFSAAVIPIET
jgi:hypothetical protein